VGGEEVRNSVRLHIIDNAKNAENCIVYLHGLASYCLEGKFLIPYLASSFSLCLFDSRGHGKNEAPFVTYGLLEAQDLLEIVRALV
jgi:pimeloyl-ACP methyl ester carboxylesterase